jgi:hypothetical protein
MCNDGAIHGKSTRQHYTFWGRQGTLLLVLSTAVFACVNFAENPSTAPQPRHAKKPTLDDQVQKLAKTLDLNEVQQSEVKRILEKQQDSIRRLRDQGAPAGTDLVTRLYAIHAQTMTQIRAILNDEQRKKYDTFAQPQVQNSSTPVNVDDWLKPAKPK